MKKMILVFIVLVLFSNLVWAEQDKSLPFSSFEFLSGYQWAKLNGQKKLQAYPLIFSFAFDLKKKSDYLSRNYPGFLHFLLEPYIAAIIYPRENISVGNAFSFKVGFFSEKRKLQPYARLGLGLSYMTLHTREQSSQFNFYEYAGLGLQYFASEKLGFTLEYRYSHLSNCGFKHPNRGINSQYSLLGLSYRF